MKMKKNIYFFETSKMYFQNLCDDIMIKIIYLLNDVKKIRLTCKKCLDITNTYGYIHSIYFGMNTSYTSFINLNTQSMRSLKKLHMDCITDAPLWIPYKWPEKIIFTNCSMGYKQIDPPISPTLSLSIKDNFSTYITDINWEKIPDLEELYIDTFNCDFKDLVKYCPNLIVVSIFLKIKQPNLPENIDKLKKLSILNTDIPATTAHHFISPHLRECIVRKSIPFTSVSKLIPLRQLEINTHYAGQ
jgi:hypothetical protein